MYTDHTAVYYAIVPYIDIMLSLKSEVDNNILQWFRAARLPLNALKTKYTIIGSRQKLGGMQNVDLVANNKNVRELLV